VSQTRERTLFRQYLTEKKLKLTGQRQAILEIFLATETHFSVEELNKHYPNIGYTTVLSDLETLKRLRFGQ
jgi:Fe2+ or Zn2+ uptake regulation protein